MNTPNRSAAAIVQVCVDVPSVEEAVAVAEMAVRAGVDWFEAGTPLILFSGIPAVGPFAAALPGRKIFADIKIVDGARKYVVAAARHGAHIVTVCGIASDATIREGVAGAREAGIQLCVDLSAAPDPVKRAREAVDMGADLVYLHYGGDQRAANPAGDRTLSLIPLARHAVDVPLGVVTFDTPSAVAAVEAGADIVLIGHPYLNGPNSEAMLTDYVRQVKAAVRP
jgi:3-hexulose-6-phosphate synthase/6-phospho-3-hexuloisomerase